MQSPNRELPSSDYAPQNTYRSYDPIKTYDGGKDFTNDRVSHERVSIAETIVRASGGTPSLDQTVSPEGSFQSDGK